MQLLGRRKYVEDKENKENKSWGCAYHGDDGDFFCSGSGKPYGPTFTVGYTIGCYLNFRNDDKMVFYTKNGINLAMTNDHISKELWEACWINSKTLDQYVDELKNKSDDTLALMSRGKAYLIIGKYEEAYTVLTRLLEIESENIIALKYRGEINYVMKRYKESISDLKYLLKIKPDDAWAKEAYKLVNGFFENEFGKWASDNSDIDSFIQQIQLKAQDAKDVIEWIPFDKFTNIKYLAKGGFGTVFKVVWTDGYIKYWDSLNSKWERNQQSSICLKSLNGSKDNIKREFLNEVENQHKHRGSSAIAIYGITRNPDDDNYMMVMQYAKQGSLRKLLDNKYNDLSWEQKINNLYYIAEGLAAIHESNLVHNDFHSGNIVNENMYSSYITDFGLCRPVSQDSSSKGIFGVLPYIAPEVLLATQICQGRRPEIRCEVPQSLLDLMNKCLDAEPQSRPTARALENILVEFCHDLENETTELYNQVEEIKNLGKNSLILNQANQTKSTQFIYQTHKQAIYTSRFLNFQNLPKPVNAAISLPTERPIFN
ncbi:kinase-like domain-containing protein [Gigaspora rosea]|uniref:Kinase-like domain-containing protein n=1 Tax=Gigaspora rosea TaxID=44941 RepID=A0A397UGY0_9GLOM|nr:kinase-like domain-containing protein [Gigaspora rosea]